MRIQLGLWTTILFLGVGHPRVAADNKVDFEQANRLLDQGNAGEAAATYEKLLRQGTSSALENNLGLAYFQSGRTGLALAHFRRAERLAPRDPDILANLQFVRSKIGRTAVSDSAAGGPGSVAFALNEWAVLILGAVWVSGALGCLCLILPKKSPVLRGYALGTAGVTVLLAIGGGVTAVRRFQESDLVVTRPDAALRQIPFPEAKSIFKLTEGLELKVLDQRQDWFLVRDATGEHRGWLQADQIVRIPVL